MIATLDKSPWQIATEEYTCDHDAMILVRYTDSLGRPSVRYQCQRCGHGEGGIKRSEVSDINALPAWNKSLDERWLAARKARVEELERERERERARESEQWWRNYTIYLRSPEWKALRRLIMERDNYTCQGCMGKFDPAHLVCHHKSYVGYNRVGRTYGFEVETLCYTCHDEWHGINSDGGVRKSEYE